MPSDASALLNLIIRSLTTEAQKGFDDLTHKAQGFDAALKGISANSQATFQQMAQAIQSLGAQISNTGNTYIDQSTKTASQVVNIFNQAAQGVGAAGHKAGELFGLYLLERLRTSMAEIKTMVMEAFTFPELIKRAIEPFGVMAKELTEVNDAMRYLAASSAQSGVGLQAAKEAALQFGDATGMLDAKAEKLAASALRFGNNMGLGFKDSMKVMYDVGNILAGMGKPIGEIDKQIELMGTDHKRVLKELGLNIEDTKQRYAALHGLTKAQARDFVSDQTAMYMAIEERAKLYSGAMTDRMDTVGTAFDKVINSITRLQNTITEAIGPVLKDMLKDLQDHITSLTNWVSTHKEATQTIFEFGVSLAKVVTVLATTVGVIVPIIVTVKTFGEAFLMAKSASLGLRAAVLANQAGIASFAMALVSPTALIIAMGLAAAGTAYWLSNMHNAKEEADAAKATAGFQAQIDKLKALKDAAAQKAASDAEQADRRAAKAVEEREEFIKDENEKLKVGKISTAAYVARMREELNAANLNADQKRKIEEGIHQAVEKFYKEQEQMTHKAIEDVKKELEERRKYHQILMTMQKEALDLAREKAALDLELFRQTQDYNTAKKRERDAEREEARKHNKEISDMDRDHTEEELKYARELAGEKLAIQKQAHNEEDAAAKRHAEQLKERVQSGTLSPDAALKSMRDLQAAGMGAQAAMELNQSLLDMTMQVAQVQQQAMTSLMSKLEAAHTKEADTVSKLTAEEKAMTDETSRYQSEAVARQVSEQEYLAGIKRKRFDENLKLIETERKAAQDSHDVQYKLKEDLLNKDLTIADQREKLAQAQASEAARRAQERVDLVKERMDLPGSGGAEQAMKDLAEMKAQAAAAGADAKTLLVYNQQMLEIAKQGSTYVADSTALEREHLALKGQEVAQADAAHTKDLNAQKEKITQSERERADLILKANEQQQNIQRTVDAAKYSYFLAMQQISAEATARLISDREAEARATAAYNASMSRHVISLNNLDKERITAVKNQQELQTAINVVQARLNDALTQSHALQVERDKLRVAEIQDKADQAKAESDQAQTKIDEKEREHGLEETRYTERVGEVNYEFTLKQIKEGEHNADLDKTMKRHVEDHTLRLIHIQTEYDYKTKRHNEELANLTENWNLEFNATSGYFPQLSKWLDYEKQKKEDSHTAAMKALGEEGTTRRAEEADSKTAIVAAEGAIKTAMGEVHDIVVKTAQAVGGGDGSSLVSALKSAYDWAGNLAKALGAANTAKANIPTPTPSPEPSPSGNYSPPPDTSLSNVFTETGPFGSGGTVPGTGPKRAIVHGGEEWLDPSLSALARNVLGAGNVQSGIAALLSQGRGGNTTSSSTQRTYIDQRQMTLQYDGRPTTQLPGQVGSLSTSLFQELESGYQTFAPIGDS